MVRVEYNEIVDYLKKPPFKLSLQHANKVAWIHLYTRLLGKRSIETDNSSL